MECSLLCLSRNGNLSTKELCLSTRWKRQQTLFSLLLSLTWLSYLDDGFNQNWMWMHVRAWRSSWVMRAQSKTPKQTRRPSDQREVAGVQHTELLASLQALCVVFLMAVLSPRAHSFTTCSPWPPHVVGSDGRDQSNTSNTLETLRRQTYSLVEGQQNKGGYRGKLSEDS